jgi:hypothetical protein
MLIGEFEMFKSNADISSIAFARHPAYESSAGERQYDGETTKRCR